jgi:hypothetical protein
MAIGAAVRAKGSWGCVRTAYLSDYSTNFFISWPKNMPDVPNVHARQTRDFRDASTINTGDGAADGTPPLQGPQDM